MSSILNNTKDFMNKPITKEGLLNFAKSPLGIGLAGSGVGALIGSQIDQEHPGRGAAIGAAGGGVLGMGISAGLRGAAKWKALSPVARGGIKTGGIIGGAVLLAAGGQAFFKPHEYSQSDIAERDDYSDYRPPNPLPASGVKSRLNTMNASGDIVFGLNNRR